MCISKVSESCSLLTISETGNRQGQKTRIELGEKLGNLVILNLSHALSLRPGSRVRRMCGLEYLEPGEREEIRSKLLNLLNRQFPAIVVLTGPRMGPTAILVTRIEYLPDTSRFSVIQI